MSDPRSTLEEYLKVTTELQIDANDELILMLKSADEDNILEPIFEFVLRLNGNKKNERNEMYRKRLVDDDAEVLYKTLNNNTFVVGLDLGYNNIGDAGATLLGSLLQIPCFLACTTETSKYNLFVDFPCGTECLNI